MKMHPAVLRITLPTGEHVTPGKRPKYTPRTRDFFYTPDVKTVEEVFRVYDRYIDDAYLVDTLIVRSEDTQKYQVVKPGAQSAKPNSPNTSHMLAIPCPNDRERVGEFVLLFQESDIFFPNYKTVHFDGQYITGELDPPLVIQNREALMAKMKYVMYSRRTQQDQVDAFSWVKIPNKDTPVSRGVMYCICAILLKCSVSYPMGIDAEKVAGMAKDLTIKKEAYDDSD